MRPIPLIRPYITEEVKTKVCEVLDSGYLTEGPVAKELEEAFTSYVGCKHSIAVTSCTTGLEIALRALQIGSGDEVIVPDYTYPATADVVAIVGATIVLVDVSPATMLIDYDRLEEAITDRTKAIIPVSLFGNPLDYDRLTALQHKYGVAIIEDAACAIGAEYKGVKVGNQADIAVFSLHPRKFITTGEGGMIVTNHFQSAEWMRSYKHFGMGVQDSRLTTSFDRIGTNYKLSDLLAAVGVVQMRHIHELLQRRLELAHNYRNLLQGRSTITIPETTSSGAHSYQSFCILIEERNRIMQQLRAEGIEVQIGTYALHQHPAFISGNACRIHGKLTGSQYAFEHCLTLPLFHELTYEDQQRIVDTLCNALQGRL
ncbi:DegT/DnrJ/EryC1/StrS aminotransferase family protein [Candidatus Vecturithrix granuli]|uniref:DegT/DnrJ/EryC1/StrS aminotransferase family protein n=1 Tax=Vecturithrix granuli TaxID=1499967 RepID=A0A081C7V4_VECG1|nr:DegT/DnrJ/EryC1/StrS aminotransferase family protein [Candidatus Vecturithrix granuli]